MEQLATKHGVWFHNAVLHHPVIGRHARCKVGARCVSSTRCDIAGDLTPPWGDIERCEYRAQMGPRLSCKMAP